MWTATCKHGNESSGSIKRCEFFNQLRNCVFPRKALLHAVNRRTEINTDIKGFALKVCDDNI